MRKNDLKIVNVKIGELKPASYNPRKLDDATIFQIKKSIEKFGLVDPILANSNPKRKNIIIGGHARVKVAEQLGFDEVPVVFVDIESEEKERELNLRLNRNLGEWDFELLKDFNKDLLMESGFDSEEVDLIYDDEVVEDEFDVEKALEEDFEPKAKVGDVYQLGDHRLMCGDSTSAEAVKILMDGKLAQMIFTDPPYNVDYEYTGYREGKKFAGKVEKVFNDKKNPVDFYKFLFNVFALAFRFSKPDMSIYVCHASKTQEQFFTALKDAGFHFSQTIIWLKETIVFARGQDYHRCYEPIWFGWKEGVKGGHYTNKTMTKEREVWNLNKREFSELLDVWFEARDIRKDYKHPTQKPVKLPERAIKKNSKIGDILFEPFNGSGSTMLACEQLKRKCFAMELDPKYVDVGIQRWEAFTGRKAIKLN